MLFYQPFCENATPGKPVQLLNTRPQILSDLREETSFLEQMSRIGFGTKLAIY